MRPNPSSGSRILREKERDARVEYRFKGQTRTHAVQMQGVSVCTLFAKAGTISRKQ